MKKLAAWISALACVIALAGCSATQNEMTPAVMVNDTLYLTTGLRSDTDGDAAADGEITSAVKRTEMPTENDQSNFGAGFKYRYGETEGTIEILLEDVWYIYTTEEVRQQLQSPEK